MGAQEIDPTYYKLTSSVRKIWKIDRAKTKLIAVWTNTRQEKMELNILIFCLNYALILPNSLFSYPID